MSDTSQHNAPTSSVKEFFFRQVERLGVFSVLAALIFVFSENDSRRQAEQQRIDQGRWEQLFKQYREDAEAYRQTIEVCCHDRLIRLEAAEATRLRPGMR
jgi:hypothetical protein